MYITAFAYFRSKSKAYIKIIKWKRVENWQRNKALSIRYRMESALFLIEKLILHKKDRFISTLP